MSQCSPSTTTIINNTAELELENFSYLGTKEVEGKEQQVSKS
jgi:hypothetical protein